MTSKIGSASLPSVPESFQQGEKFIKWDDEYGVGTPVTLRIDKNGFFLYWIDQNKEMDVLDIATIKDSRTGKLAKIPKEGKLRQMVCMGSQDEPLDEKTITLALGQDFVNLTFVNFCSNTKETAQAWTELILRLAYSPAQLNCSLQTTLAKLHTRLCLAQDKQGNIQVKNIVKYFAQNKEDRKKVKTALETTGLPSGKDDIISPEKFTYEDFFTFYKNLTQRGDVEKIFDEFCEGKKGGMTVTQVVEFLNKCQRDPRLNEILHPYADEARATSLIKQYEPDEQLAATNRLSLKGFVRYLVGEESLVVFPTKQDMDQTLSCYFINSSHNTYLTGHQLTGKSSVEMYRQCLLAGCRCVELDLWNGSGKSEEPTVVHGYTLVPDLQAKDVIQTIAQSAFVTSDYPVILSFENHCNPRQQAKIANYCREFFGDTLLDKPLDSYSLDSGIPLPPPSQLKRKIIIKNKKRNPVLERSPGEARAAIGDAEAEVEDPPPTPIETTNGFALKEEIEKVQGASKAPKEVVEVDSSTKTTNDISSPKEEPKEVHEEVTKSEIKTLNREATKEEELSVEPAKEETPKVDPKEQEEESKTKAEAEAGAEISALVNYVQPVHFSSFDESEKKDRSFEMSSFDEKQATSLLKESPIEFVNYNKRQLSRVYPAGTRFDSSNFMPQVFWNAGCQLVALNYQTLDLAMQLNLGIFEYNCRSGYLLKPEFMRRTDRRFDPFAESTVDGIIAGTVVVHVISGQLLTDKRCGTYVEVDMFGLPADTVRKKFKTKVVPNNAINPVYDDEPFVFKKVVLPELACLRISAYEENGKFIGHRVLPLQALCPGYRHVGLRSESGQPLGAATLFLHIIVKDYVPDGLTELAEALANPIKYQSELDRREKQLAVLTEGMDILEDKEDEVGAMKSPAERTVLKREVSRVSCERGTSVTGSVEAEGGIEVTVAGLEAFMEAEGAITAAQLHADRQPQPQQARIDLTHISDLAQQMQADSLDKFLSSKPVMEKKMELEKKLDALRKKQEKERERAEDPDRSTTNCLPNINRLSANKPVSGAEELARLHLAQEQALKEKYHSMVFTILSKAVATRQAAQLKELSSALERETAAVMRRLQAQRSKELRRLSKQHRHKDELNRMKREVGSAMVERGVEERVRLRALYERQREQLEQQHANVRSLLEQECNKTKTALQRELEERMPKAEEAKKTEEQQVEAASPVVNNHSG